MFLGLDNSGKTSIILSLQKKINLLDYVSLKTTKDYDITEIEDKDSKHQVWDFGGQYQYRDKHLRNLNNYLTGATKIIYVIDVQDKKKYDLSLEYFNNILNVIKKENVQIKLSIFFHKFDPDLKIDEKIVSDLTSRIIELIPQNLNYLLFKTSIYTVFRKISIL